MKGIILSLATAGSTSAKDFVVKKSATTGKSSRLAIIASYFVFSLPVLIVIFAGAVFFWQHLPQLKPQFWLALAVNAPLLVLANYNYVKALELSEMSLSVPLLAFTPIGIMPIAAIWLNEKPTGMGLLGVVLIVVGSFLLNVKKGPTLAIIKDKGAPYMLITAFIWSITSVMDKVGIKGCLAESAFYQAITWSVTKTIAVSLTLIILLSIKKRFSLSSLLRPKLYLTFAGFFYGIEQITQMWAVSVWDVAYVNAVKRVSIILSTIVGVLKFREKSGIKRILAAAIMVAGIIVISISK